MDKLENIVAYSRDGKGLMNAERRQLIQSLFEQYIRMFSARDKHISSYFSKNFTGYAGSSTELIIGEAQLLSATQQDFAQVPEHIGIVTVSLGVASLMPVAEYPPVELVKLADIALYRAKSAGRNRVEVYDCPVPEMLL